MLTLNGNEIITENFPNNETKVKDFKEYVIDGENILEFKYSKDCDLITLMFVKKRIDEFNVPCILFIWYMPYSRMDRKIEGDLFTLSYVTQFINYLNFEKVIVMEPHSEKTINMLEKVVDIYPVMDFLTKVKDEIGFSENDHIVFPDKGAVARYANSECRNICILEKKRNPINDHIEDMKLKKGNINPGSKCIIIDDLCSKGDTVVWAGNILKDLGASEIYVLVTHCEETIFSRKILDIDSPINKIYTSSSIMDKTHPKIQYMEVDVKKYIKE